MIGAFGIKLQTGGLVLGRNGFACLADRAENLTTEFAM